MEDSASERLVELEHIILLLFWRAVLETQAVDSLSI